MTDMKNKIDTCLEGLEKDVFRYEDDAVRKELIAWAKARTAEAPEDREACQVETGRAIRSLWNMRYIDNDVVMSLIHVYDQLYPEHARYHHDKPFYTDVIRRSVYAAVGVTLYRITQILGFLTREERQLIFGDLIWRPAKTTDVLLSLLKKAGWIDWTKCPKEGG